MQIEQASKSTMTAQKQWIGKSTGCQIVFDVEGSESDDVSEERDCAFEISLKIQDTNLFEFFNLFRSKFSDTVFRFHKHDRRLPCLQPVPILSWV